MENSFSIVIPTNGPLGNLFNLLESLKAFHSEPALCEVIAVLNGPRSASFVDDQVLKLISEYPKFKIVREKTESLLAGRHRGVMETTGSVISFLDDDVVPTVSWFSSLVAAFESPLVTLAGGPSTPVFEGKTPRWLEKTFFARHEDGWANTVYSLMFFGDKTIMSFDPTYVWGLNLSIRRDALMAVGGFHPDLCPSDKMMFHGDGETGLSRKLAYAGYKAAYFPGLAVTHRIGRERLTKRYLADWAFKSGISEEYTRLRENREVPPTRRWSVEHMILDRIAVRLPDFVARFSVGLLFRKWRQRGSQFLREKFLKLEEVREWVRRPDYWDWEFPG